MFSVPLVFLPLKRSCIPVPRCFSWPLIRVETLARLSLNLTAAYPLSFLVVGPSAVTLPTSAVEPTVPSVLKLCTRLSSGVVAAASLPIQTTVAERSSA